MEQAYLSEAQSYLGDKVVYLDIPTNDAWARDTGPTILVNDKGKKLAVDWAFNAWGGTYDGLYQDYEEDDQVASRFAEALEGLSMMLNLLYWKEAQSIAMVKELFS